jgi:hypothetical protein
LRAVRALWKAAVAIVQMCVLVLLGSVSVRDMPVTAIAVFVVLTPFSVVVDSLLSSTFRDAATLGDGGGKCNRAPGQLEGTKTATSALAMDATVTPSS